MRKTACDFENISDEMDCELRIIPKDIKLNIIVFKYLIDFSMLPLAQIMSANTVTERALHLSGPSH